MFCFGSIYNTFNNLQISMAEAASSNPQLRSMGLRGMMGLFTVMGGASYGVKTLYNSFTGFDDEAMALYKKYFAPDYMKNSDMLAFEATYLTFLSALSRGRLILCRVQS